MSMSTEEIIKNETEKHIVRIKNKLKEDGYNLTKEAESYFRLGVQYGITIAGLALVKTETNNLI